MNKHCADEFKPATLVPALRPMVSEKQILDRIPIARSTLQNWEKEGHFPKSVQIGPNRKAWYEDEVVAWQRQREQGRARPRKSARVVVGATTD
jgi:prophage regulatory protein